VVGNDEIAARLGSTVDWIESRSGIVSRRFADSDETLAAMAVSAGTEAVKHAGRTIGQLDCVVVASTSNLVSLPPLSVAVSAGLGAVNAGAFDVSAACAGFCHALAVANDMVAAGDAEHVLVVGVERMSDITDPDDRDTAFMFGDGAGAVVVGPSAEPGIGPTIRGADTNSLAALTMSASWAEFGAGRVPAPPTIRMDGRRVFRWAVENTVPASLAALRAAGITVDDLAAFIPHQANRRMLQLLTDRLRLPKSVAVACDITTAGNTSAASIPLGMEQLLRSGAVAGGGPALLIGFGAGLNYAAQVVLLPPAFSDAGVPA
jgi:3-oxoacyl-(acyl-carrier-protein) synthase III